MVDLLKNDLKRSVKDKLFLVLLIISAVFALMTPILFKVIFLLLEVDPESMAELEMLGINPNAKTMFFSAFSLGNNFGFVLPIFVAIILCKDFSHGTIRNKIISGKSRGSIYLSMLSTCAILVVFFILTHAILTLLVSLIFFDYQSGGFGASDFGYFVASLGFELLIYFLVAALLTFFIVYMKNAGLSIVMYFVVAFAFIIVGSITQTVILFAEQGEVGYKVLEFLNTANPFVTTAIGNGTSYSGRDVLYLLLPNSLLTLLLATLGYVVFQRKDIK